MPNDSVIDPKMLHDIKAMCERWKPKLTEVWLPLDEYRCMVPDAEIPEGVHETTHFVRIRNQEIEFVEVTDAT